MFRIFGNAAKLFEIKHESTTNGIVHAGLSDFRGFVARKKSWYNLIGNRLVLPHDTIPSTVILKHQYVTKL